jgi:hypothetical protein
MKTLFLSSKEVKKEVVNKRKVHIFFEKIERRTGNAV